MKQKSWILIFCAALLLLVLCAALLPRRSGEKIGVYQDGRLLLTLEAAQSGVWHVSGPAGENEIRAENGQVFVARADCPDQICVRHGPLTRSSGPIVCLPNRLSIRYLDGALQPDAVAGTGGAS